MTPYPLTPGFAASKNKLLSDDPIVLLFEIEVPTDPPQRVRLTSHDNEIDWRGHSYTRAPAMHSELVEDSEGNLPTVQLTVPNVSREIAAVMKAHNGLAGQTVRVSVVSIADLTTDQPIREQDFTIADGTLDVKAAVFRLQVFNPHRATVPGGRLSRQGCWYKFRGIRCGYSLPETITGAVVCDHTYDGPDGCTAKGVLEVAAGLTATHPKRIGVYRSIPKRPQGGGL